MQNTNQAQKEPCCENQCSTCKCKVPMIIGCVVFSFFMFALGVFLGKTYFFSSAGKNSGVSPTPTSVVSVSTAQPTVDPTVNWKIYKGKNFTFKYPETWSVQNVPSELIPVSTKETVTIRVSPNAIFTVSAKTDNYQERIDYAKSVNNPLIENIVVDNKKAIRFEMTGDGRGPIFGSLINIFMKVSDNNITYYQIGYNGEKQQDTDIILSQILSTFKFTEKNDERIVLTLENIPQYNGKTQEERCNQKFNTDLANTTVEYLNEGKGISFNVPYNYQWGSAAYKINLFEDDVKNNRVVFGNITAAEACGWMRELNLRFLPTHLEEEAIKEVENRQSGMCAIKPTKEIINGLTTLKYSATCGLGQNAYVQVVGKKFNYEFYSFFGDTKSLAEIAKTVKLIE